MSHTLKIIELINTTWVKAYFKIITRENGEHILAESIVKFLHDDEIDAILMQENSNKFDAVARMMIKKLWDDDVQISCAPFEMENDNIPNENIVAENSQLANLASLVEEIGMNFSSKQISEIAKDTKKIEEISKKFAEGYEKGMTNDEILKGIHQDEEDAILKGLKLRVPNVPNLI